MASQFSPLFQNALPLDTKRNSGLARAFFYLARKQQKTRKLMVALNGVAPGATATLAISRVQHSQTQLGGKRPVTSVTDMSRATVAGDVTNITNYLTKVSKIATPTRNWGLKFRA